MCLPFYQITPIILPKMNNVAPQEIFFEGAEKLLEIWFTGQTEADNSDLRKIPRQKFENVLKLAHCEVISFSSNENIDAYILSESSMFVSRRRLILKTCGTTTPLACIKVLIMLVTQYSGFNIIEKLFYSHKNFEKPGLQKKMYQNFRSEVVYLDACFKSNGSVHYFTAKGDADDNWQMYVLYSKRQLNKTGELSIVKGGQSGFKEPDQTIEICMSGLDARIMSIFTVEECSTADQATKKSGIDKLIPLMHIDDYLFKPCGYSMNGILPNGAYMTIHITPEIDYSYVSFETNIRLSSYKELIKQVLNTFQPSKALVTLFANQGSLGIQIPLKVNNTKAIDSWRQTTSYTCQVNDYDVNVAFYSKFPS